MGECMSARLEQQVQDYQQWRDELVTAITSYQAWLDDHSEFEAQQSLKIFDLVESLKQDHVTLAFVAEFSRGKSELINALFGTRPGPQWRLRSSSLGWLLAPVALGTLHSLPFKAPHRPFDQGCMGRPECAPETPAAR